MVAILGMLSNSPQIRSPKLDAINLVELDGKHLQLVIDAAENTDVSKESFDSIHESYFSWCDENKLNTQLGAVRTPPAIARLIIKSAATEADKALHEMSWLDRCPGQNEF